MNDETTKLVQKLSFICNELFEQEIVNNIEVIRKNENLPKETVIYLDYAKKSIDLSKSVLSNNDFVNSLCLLRSSFESILIAIAINIDDEIYRAYKSYNDAVFSNKVSDKTKKSRKSILSPGNIRSAVANNFKPIFKDFFEENASSKNVKEELDKMYSHLCNFTHPSISKAYVFTLQNNEKNLNDIMIFFSMNINYCMILLLICLNYFNNTLKSKIYCDLYLINSVLLFSEIKDLKETKKLLNKYEEFLYIKLNYSYIKKEQNKFFEFKSLFDELKKDNNIAFNFSNRILEVITSLNPKFDLTYFEEN